MVEWVAWGIVAAARTPIQNCHWNSRFDCCAKRDHILEKRILTWPKRMKRRAFFIVCGALISLGLDSEHSMKKNPRCRTIGEDTSPLGTDRGKRRFW
jgi:hypothetical protein